MWLQQGEKNGYPEKTRKTPENLQNLNQAPANGFSNFLAGSSRQRGAVGRCPSRAGTGPISAQESGCSGPVGRSPTAAPFPSGSRGPGGRLRAGSPAGGPRRRRRRHPRAARPGGSRSPAREGTGKAAAAVKDKADASNSSPPRRSAAPPALRPFIAHLCLPGQQERQASLPPSPGLGSRSPRGAPELGRRVRALTMRGGTRYRAVLDVSRERGGGCGPARPPCGSAASAPGPGEGGEGPAAILGGSEGAWGSEGKLSERARGGAGRAGMQALPWLVLRWVRAAELAMTRGYHCYHCLGALVSGQAVPAHQVAQRGFFSPLPSHPSLSAISRRVWNLVVHQLRLVPPLLSGTRRCGDGSEPGDVPQH